MKFLCQLVVSVGFLGLASTGCERHEFAETQKLHMEHGKGHEAHAEVDHGESPSGESHGKDPHAAEADHGKKEAEAKAAEAKPVKTEAPRATGL
ncbi:MAG TPA: hypothetical protein PK529_02740 [Verrucomicrobiales bacterium]|nr:hypothetical protein [Verrucomicrobiales bacterium]